MEEFEYVEDVVDELLKEELGNKEELILGLLIGTIEEPELDERLENDEELMLKVLVNEIELDDAPIDVD